MPRISINQTNFTQGQISKHFAGRYDSKEYLEGALELTNVIVRPEGGVVRRPGTKLIYNGVAGSKGIGFQIDGGSAAKILFQPNNTIVIIDPVSGTQTLSGTGLGVNIHHMDYAKVRSSLIIVHRSFAPKELKRTFNTSTSLWEWSIGNWVFKDGPWEELNLNPQYKFRPEADNASNWDPVPFSGGGFIGTGNLKIVNKNDNPVNWIGTSGALFDAFSVGRKIRFRQINTSPAEEKWAVFTINSKNTTDVNVTVDPEYPFLNAGINHHSKNWRLSAWYPNNYPDKVALHQDRLWFFRDGWRWATKASDLDTFSPSIPSLNDDTYQVTNDSAVSIEGISANSESPKWAVSYQALHTGTDGGGQIIQGQSTYAAITPSTVSIASQHGLPVGEVKPVLGRYLYFTDSSQRRIFRLEYQYIYNAFLPIEVTANQHDLFDIGIKDMEFINYPWKMLWVVLEDGSIAVGTMDDKEENFAWSKIVLANNNKARYIFSTLEDWVFPAKQKVYIVDAGGDIIQFGDIETRKADSLTTFIYTGSSPYTASVVYDTEEFLLDYLTEYESGTSFNLSTLLSTQSLVIKTTYANYLTKSETITPANDYQVGASFYASMRLKPVDYIQSQTSNKKDLKSFQRIFFNLVDSGEFQIAEENTMPEGALVWKDVKFWDANSNVTTPPALFTGEKEIDYGSTQTFKPTLLIKQTKNVPFQVNSVSYDININEIK
jgi:hypothetical protein